MPIPLELQVAKSKLHGDLNKRGREKKKANAKVILWVEETCYLCSRYDLSRPRHSTNDTSRLDHSCDDKQAVPL